MKTKITKEKVICFFFRHKFTGWELHPIRGDKLIRHCTRCGRTEEKF
jgi:hypothetical protein